MPKKRANPTPTAPKVTEPSIRQGLERFVLSSWGGLRRIVISYPKIVALIVLCLAGIFLYFNSIHNEFVFDDNLLIVKNFRIQDLKNIPRILGVTGRHSYRPLREISYTLDYQFTGLNPVGYHLSNILYHILTSFCVFLVAFRLSKDIKVGFIAGLLFMAHPIQTESVAYISGRRDILTALFYLMGFYFFLRYRESLSKKYLFLIFCSYYLSLLSKEMGVTLPAVILLYDLIEPVGPVLHPENPGPFLKGLLFRLKTILKRNWPLYLGLFLVAVLFTIDKAVVRNPSRQEGFYGGSASTNFLTVFRIWVFYIKVLMLPLSLNAGHSFSLSKSILEPRTYLSIALLLAIFLSLILLLKNKKIYSFCGFWFFLTLLPVSHIFPHHELLAEHYLYLPAFGFCLAGGLLFSSPLQRKRAGLLLSGFLIALFVFYGYQTIQRNRIWSNDSTLWTDTVQKSPDNVRAHLNLIAAYNRLGLYDQAISGSLALLNKEPKNDEIYMKLGVSYMLKEEYDKALENFKTAIQIKARNPMAYNNLGVLYIKRKEFDQAIEAFQKVLASFPFYADAYHNLAEAYAGKGLIDQAIEEEKKALRLNPMASEYHFNLARYYENKGLAEEAIREWREALKVDPRFFEAYYEIGMIYSKMENHVEAIHAFEKAIQIGPRSGKAYFMLGINQVKTGETKKAIQNLEKALPFVPSEAEREKIKSFLGRLRSPSK